MIDETILLRAVRNHPNKLCCASIAGDDSACDYVVDELEKLIVKIKNGDLL